KAQNMYRSLVRFLVAFPAGFRAALSIASVALACLPVAHAQGLGSLSGTITDPSGAAIPAASVTATEVGTGFARTVATGNDGHYVIPDLRPVDYTLSVQAQGFRRFS